MRIEIKIQCDNKAFHDPAPSFEVARILRELARRVDERDEPSRVALSLYDLNGNKVGSFTMHRD